MGEPGLPWRRVGVFFVIVVLAMLLGFGGSWRASIGIGAGMSAWLAVVMFLLFGGRRVPHGVASGGDFVVRPAFRARVVAPLYIFVPPVLGLAAAATIESGRDLAIILSMLLVLAGIGAFVLWGMQRLRIRVSSLGFERRELGRPTVSVAWTDVVEVSLDAETAVLSFVARRVKGSGINRVDVPSIWDGYGTFADLALRGVPHHALAEGAPARAKLEEMARAVA